MNRPSQLEAGGVQRTDSQIRCAIYTRKSTDEGLDQDFNSLDAQREAAEAFILSQRGEGLVALPERYDDGGFSGGSLDRPALKRLLADIRAGAVDCVVVYKVDRLSRSLIDFARIIEIFERHNVSFVSVTQQFNTTNSLGRLTLNILLSFAQFEREIIAERTRDKLSAARRKGKWIGGRPVLGYDIDPRCSRLNVNADEAFQVRAIFTLYLDYSALSPVVREINRRGWRTKQWVTSQGLPLGGTPFSKGRIFRLLKNPIYIGKVAFGNQIYRGEHEAIIDVSIWDRVQQVLTSNGRDGGREVRSGSCIVPQGLLRCTCCDTDMILTRSSKDPGSGRYYVCTLGRRGGRAHCRTGRVSQRAVMEAIVQEIRRLVCDPRVAARVMAKAEEQMQAIIADLTLERQVTQRAMTTLRTNAVIANCPERIDQMEGRLAEIGKELRALERQTVDTEARAALAQFWPVWQLLNRREQTRIVAGFIERVIYDGKTGGLAVDLHSCQHRNKTAAFPPVLLL